MPRTYYFKGARPAEIKRLCIHPEEFLQGRMITLDGHEEETDHLIGTGNITFPLNPNWLLVIDGISMNYVCDMNNDEILNFNPEENFDLKLEEDEINFIQGRLQQENGIVFVQIIFNTQEEYLRENKTKNTAHQCLLVMEKTDGELTLTFHDSMAAGTVNDEILERTRLVCTYLFRIFGLENERALADNNTEIEAITFEPGSESVCTLIDMFYMLKRLQGHDLDTINIQTEGNKRRFELFLCQCKTRIVEFERGESGPGAPRNAVTTQRPRRSVRSKLINEPQVNLKKMNHEERLKVRDSHLDSLDIEDNQKKGNRKRFHEPLGGGLEYFEVGVVSKKVKSDLLTAAEHCLYNDGMRRLAQKVAISSLEFKPMFADFDKPQTGYVSANQFHRVLHTVGLASVTASELEAIIKRFSVTGKSSINYIEFLAQLDALYYVDPITMMSHHRDESHWS